MSTAINICASAYRQAKLDQDLTSFTTTQEFPYNISLDLMNTVIQEMNRAANYWFTETSVPLVYTAGLNSYSLNTLVAGQDTGTYAAIDPQKVSRIRREGVVGQVGQMTEMSWKKFQQRFRINVTATGQPNYWAKYNSTIAFDTIPDQNYGLVLYYYNDINVIQATTDVLGIPLKYEDTIREGIYAYVLQRMGRPDAAQCYQLWQSKIQSLQKNDQVDVALPMQMPAAF